MSYFYMSNISNFDNVTTPDESYLQVGVYTGSSTETPENGVIKFTKNNIDYTASFLMIRARADNDVLVELYPSQYGVYIPAGELWSVDSLDSIDKFYIRNIFTYRQTSETTYTPESTNTGYIQWMIGYK